jgi:hypothetical protein
VLCTGCSTFNRDWKAAAKTFQPNDDITGAWDGAWLSDVNGHHGRLRAIVSRNGPDGYTARFKARFWKIFTYGYTIPLRARRESGQGWLLNGEENLGKLAGGVYHYAAQADPEKFHSTYSNKYDHGTFDLKRPRT